MALTLSSSNPDQSAFTRPTDQYDPNGIAHATNTVTPANTKADRATAKLAYALFVQDVKIAVAVGDSAGPSEFPVAGSAIAYADD